VVFVERGATADERIVTATLDDVAGGRVDVGSPAVWVIGEVVDAVSWRSAERAPAADRIEDDTVRAIA
jgi:siroheme synthase